MRRPLATAALLLMVCFCLQISAGSAVSEARSVDPFHAYAYEEMLNDAVALQSRYPELIRLDTIGGSVEGRKLLLIRFGTGQRNIFVDGTMHASEYIATSYIMYMLEQYGQAYQASGSIGDFNLREILNSVTFCIVPMVNPDGVNLVQNGPAASLNPGMVASAAENDTEFSGYSGWKANIRGVDLNRNFDNNWYVTRPVTAPAPRLYKGAAPLSEPESLAMKNYVDNTMCWAFVNFHSAGEGLYGWDDQNAGYYPQLTTMVSRLVASTGYIRLSDSAETDYGTFAGYVRDTFLKPAITLELGRYSGRNPYPDKDFLTVWEPAKFVCLIVAEEVMKMAPQEYLVFQSGEFRQAFVDEAYAAKYAVSRPECTVVRIPGGIGMLPSGQAVKAGFYLNGQAVSPLAYAINGSSCIKLRDIAALLSGSEKRFSVEYDPVTKEIALTTGRPYMPVGGELAAAGCPAVSAVPSQSTVSLDGLKTALTVYTIGGSNYVRLREVGRAMNFAVTWDRASRAIRIDTTEKYVDEAAESVK